LKRVDLMKILANKTITDVPGILASGIASGIKADGKKDLCVIYSKYKANATAVFTTNRIKGAPILIDMENIKGENIQAVVVNSGNANSCTGEEGISNARKMLEAAAQYLKLNPEEVLIQSTGAMAVQLPMDKLIPGIEKACSLVSEYGGFDAAEAILTTDTKIKTLAVEFEIQGKKVIIAGIAKGSTMIHPNMATMFSVIATSANISKTMLEKAFKTCVEKSYNMISIDGDTSTNDMAAVLANGASGNELIEEENKDFKIFEDTLKFVSIELAKKITVDGEGATKLLEIQVMHAKTVDEAKKCAKTIAASTLVKCAMFGSYPAYSDIACAIGYSGVDFKLDDYDIFIQSGDNKLQLLKNAVKAEFDQDHAKAILSQSLVTVIVDLKNGEENSTSWGCDMSRDYVKANAYLKS
jgi:glutamate N-acetyltransferase / amino-acid N-acetyltransferase